MVMMTSPCFDCGEQANGQPWPRTRPPDWPSTTPWSAGGGRVPWPPSRSSTSTPRCARLVSSPRARRHPDPRRVTASTSSHRGGGPVARRPGPADVIRVGRLQMAGANLSTPASADLPAGSDIVEPTAHRRCRGRGTLTRVNPASGQGDEGGGIDDGGGVWPKTVLSAAWHCSFRAPTSVDSGTRLLSETVVMSACH